MPRIDGRAVFTVVAMSRAPAIFRQSDITRAIRGALAAGVENVRVEIAKDGREAPIEPGARLRITAWPRSAPDGTWWLSLSLEPYPSSGRPTTAHKQASR
jgi:hypothetical protein